MLREEPRSYSFKRIFIGRLNDPYHRPAIAIQQIPAPTFQEARRAEFVRALFIDEGLADVKMDETGNVYARLAGKGAEKALPRPVPQKIWDDIRDSGLYAGTGMSAVVSAHLDTIFPASVDLHFERLTESRAPSGNRDCHPGTGTTARIQAPGIGDNSLGVAGLFGLVWELRQRNLTLPGDLWLVANVCEEGLGNLNGIRAVVDHFGSDPLAYIVLEGMALGHITHRGLGARRYRITIRTPGGHSWVDYGQPSAIHELTALSTRILALNPPLTPHAPSGNQDRLRVAETGAPASHAGTGTTPRTTLNIGIISGGSSVNSIAAEAMLELDLRSESAERLETLAMQVEQIVHAAKNPGVTVEAEMIGNRPSGEIPAEHALVRLAQDCLRAVGMEPHLNTGSTDANLPLSRGLACITIGLTTGGRAHSMQEFINLAPLEKGMEQVTRLVCKVWDVL